MLILPLSIALATPRSAVAAAAAALPPQSFRHAMAEAFGHRSYVLLVLGFFTCGFQLAFVTVHLPSYLIDRGLSAQIGGWTLATIGLFNIVGSLAPAISATACRSATSCRSSISPARCRSSCSSRCRRARSTTLIFGAVTGLLWLSTVPPTSALVAVMFGTRWLAMLFGFAFFSHQVGGFLGVLARRLRVRHLRLVQSGVVALGVLRRDVGDHQPADRREARWPARPGGRLRRLRPEVGRAPRMPSGSTGEGAWRHSRRS